jgi:hypothetical protein
MLLVLEVKAYSPCPLLYFALQDFALQDFALEGFAMERLLAIARDEDNGR